MRPEFATHLRALLIALGLYAAGALVWFAGPLIQLRRRHAAGQRTRARDRDRGDLAGVRGAGDVARHRRRAAQPPHGRRPAAQGRCRRPQAAPGAPEVAAIGQRFAQAMQVLRGRRVGGAKAALGWLKRPPYVYELPWYIVIGAPGAGKTTTIVNSGLEFPLAAELGPQGAARRRRHAQLRLVVHLRRGADRHRRPLHHARQLPRCRSRRMAGLPSPAAAAPAAPADQRRDPGA